MTLSKKEVDDLRLEYPAYIEFGSDEHAALLGIAEEEAFDDPKERAKRERALESEPTIQSRKQPVTRRNYRRDEPIMEGFARRGP